MVEGFGKRVPSKALQEVPETGPSAIRRILESIGLLGKQPMIPSQAAARAIGKDPESPAAQRALLDEQIAASRSVSGAPTSFYDEMARRRLGGKE